MLADVSEGCWTESCVPTLTERRPSLAGGSPAVLCVISIAVSFLVVSLPPSEETWQPPQRSTRPVSLSPVSVYTTFLHHIRAKRAECFCSRLLWRRAEAKRRQAAEAWLPASIPFPPPSRCFALNAAFISPF